jgi:hypothetical protein
MQGKACAALGFNKACKSLLIFSFFFPFDTQQVSWEIFEKVGADISKNVMATKVDISFFKTPTKLWREKYSG